MDCQYCRPVPFKIQFHEASFMCGRYSLTFSSKVLQYVFDLPETSDLPPHYNVAPGMVIPVVRAEDNIRKMVYLRWGFVPHWARDEPKKLLINARSETLYQKPSFRDAARKRRCLVPADGFYEWQGGGKGSAQPFFIKPQEDGPIAFAGIWDSWKMPSGEIMETVAIITTQANEALQSIHHRMPVVVSQIDFDRWLNADAGDEIFELPGAVDNVFFEAIPVGPAVNKVANNSPGLQERTSRQTGHPGPEQQLNLFARDKES
jgi:putative SOS response-associated peptidase YedK